MSTNPRNARVLSFAALACSIALLCTGVMTSILAWGTSPVTPQQGADLSPQDQDPPALAETVPRLRLLPLRTPSGPVSTKVGTALQVAPNHRDIQNLRDLIDDTARKMGALYPISELASISLNSALNTQTSYIPAGDDHSTHAPYPYGYPYLPETLSYYFQDGLTTATTSQIIDLTALLIIAGSLPGGIEGKFPYAAPIANQILRDSPHLPESCDLQTQLAFTVALGHHVIDDNLAREVRKSEELCPGDVTARWLLSQSRASSAFRVDPPHKSEPVTSRPELMRRAVADFKFLRDTYPASPIGWAGQADLLLDRADLSEERGLRPFQVRAWRNEAVEMYQYALRISSDPELNLGLVRALSALGKIEQAESLLREVPHSMTTTYAYASTYTRVLQDKKDFQGIVEFFKITEFDPPQRIAMHPGGPETRMPGYGRWSSNPSLVTDATFLAGSGGASTSDSSFIPQHRDTWRTDGSCLTEDVRVAHLVTSSPAEFESRFVNQLSPTSKNLPCSPSSNHLPRSLDNTTWDVHQDIYRWAGDLDSAASAIPVHQINDWQDWTLHQRAGEVASLGGDHAQAIVSFQAAIEIASEISVQEISYGSPDISHPLGILDVQKSHALTEAGLTEEGISLLRTSASKIIGIIDSSPPESMEIHTAVDRESLHGALFYIYGEIGESLLARQDFPGAVDALRKSIDYAQLTNERTAELLDHEGDNSLFAILRGSQENNLALALASTSSTSKKGLDDSISIAKLAVSRDPYNPVFLDTLAFTFQAKGDTRSATQYYEEALEKDESSYVSANNLATLLATSGDLADAERLITAALTHHPSYATGWHNLGVVKAKLGSREIEAQSSFGIAGRLDRSLRGAPQDLIVDRVVYESGLDVSKSLSPEWRYAKHATSPRNDFTVTMAALLLLAILGALLRSQFESVLTRRLLSAAPQGGLLRQGVWRQVPVWLALATSVASLSWPAIQWSSGRGQTLLLVTSIGGIVMVAFFARSVLASTTNPGNIGWLPAVATSVVAAPLGASIAPFPGVDDTLASSPRVRWAAATVTGVVALALVTLAWLSAIPLSRFMAMASLALFASIMLPFDPFDGKRLADRRLLIGMGLVLATATVAFGQAWI